MKASAETYYRNRIAGIGSDKLRLWEAEIIDAEGKRLNDRSVMDIMISRKPEANGSELVRSAGADRTPGVPPRLTSKEIWVKLGLDIQDLQ